ncbi:ELONGATION FACTOR P (EF-P) FAMILY PROTEIN [Salix purpurea]|uniref:ELONGATION FACTOR P (EF-P) FAMILY PROTEIN n=1 Tax=Salix purpurea TaxID=77065 RepID=A0A9Q1ABW3_SALPP|nr:ELONGATION FACTOR P (EF-P) FAMILY PROTEIN [Salix purpurea]
MARTTAAALSSPYCILHRSSFSYKPSFLPMRIFPKTPSPPTFPRIYAFSSNDIKVGSNIEVDGAPWRVLEFLHEILLRKTFRAGSTIEEANVFKEAKQFTYKDGAQFVFMDLSTFEEYRLGEADVGDKTKWLKEGMDCNLLFWNGKVIDFELPVTVQLSVVDVDPGLKGDTAQGGTKPATLDTGAVVNVPLFVNIGEEILVDTRTGQYMSRA